MKIAPHPDQHALMARLTAVGADLDVAFNGTLYRFINPSYSKRAHIVDGAGALHAAGRWHSQGAIRLSYTAISPQTALTEALAQANYYNLPLTRALPRVLVALQLQASRVLDLRLGEVRRTLRLSAATMQKTDWRAENRHGREAITQAWGRGFAAAGFEAVIVPSAADAAGANVLVFPDNLRSGTRFEVENDVIWPAL